MSGYDAHLFIRELGELPGNINAIANTKENYVSFTIFFPINIKEFMAVRFVDSLKFLGTSLEKVAENLTVQDFIYLSRFYPLLVPIETSHVRFI